ncbi:calcium-binding protein [Planomonospora venezuelensis]|uniref:Ca2+-binding RTX toxin-like protein n=1 Tax=Planomonospora venezuelensis TaxID=1999 RepID=A0A841CUE7_PLAVE|nr:hypothetical protein [Planomonospora venezuelensis]MBB5960939.1 Ca2+-binding RTX toxin-like protein [Planomonospora venezuelensis]GIN01173.1 hypothetical protein Pve01_28310 [Planomonospora venezuelensis]
MNDLKRGALRLSLIGSVAAGILAAAPTAGNAAVGELQIAKSGATMTVTAGTVTRNDNITVQAVSGRIHVFGSGIRAVQGGGCTQVSAGEVDCGNGVTGISADLGSGNDRFSSLVEINGTVDGGSGDDSFSAGRSPRGTGLTYRGGLGRDTVDYSSSSTGVVVTKGVGAQLDGRASVDRDNVSVDVEVIRGTGRTDTLVGGTGADTLIGGNGADILRGNGGNDTIDARDSQGTKDTTIDCGAGADTATADAADAPVNCESVGRR